MFLSFDLPIGFMLHCDIVWSSSHLENYSFFGEWLQVQI